jgi:hypothetical protein
MLWLLLILLSLPVISSLDIIGWFVPGNFCNNEINSTNFPFEYYTHVVVSQPIVLENGTALCNQSDTFLKDFVKRAHSLNKKVIWHDGISDIKNVILNNSWLQYRKNYLNSINLAVKLCLISGIEVDWEPPLGIVTVTEAQKYTLFLTELKLAIGFDKTVGADVGVWGVTEGSFPLMNRPWLNVSMFNVGPIDYINTMSYHWPEDGGIGPWLKDAFLYTKMWGFNPKKVNIGLPYYSFNRSKLKDISSVNRLIKDTSSTEFLSMQDSSNRLLKHSFYTEPLWCDLSPLCPNILPELHICNDVKFMSKNQNYMLGQFIKESGFRGAFPWTGNFDTFTNNNSLINWLYAGLNS